MSLTQPGLLSGEVDSTVKLLRAPSRRSDDITFNNSPCSVWAPCRIYTYVPVIFYQEPTVLLLWAGSWETVAAKGQFWWMQFAQVCFPDPIQPSLSSAATRQIFWFMLSSLIISSPVPNLEKLHVCSIYFFLIFYLHATENPLGVLTGPTVVYWPMRIGLLSLAKGKYPKGIQKYIEWKLGWAPLVL